QDNHPTNVDVNTPQRKRLTWEESYELLCQYKQTHGHCNVPQSQKPLGSFVNRQRIDHARFLDPNSKKPTAMTPRRKKLLEEIGFVWDNMEQTWNIRYKELCEFRKKNGHAVVPRSHGPLGAWVEKQRIEYKKFKALHEDDPVERAATPNSGDKVPRTTLTKERVQKLNDVGFVYDVREKQFEQNVGALRIFREMNGHIDPRFMNGKLGLWVRKWEQHYRKYLEALQIHPQNATILSEILPESRLEALESVGFSPNMFDEPRVRAAGNQRATWDERYEELVSFKNEHSHCMVPKNYGPLGSWVRAQRHLMKERGTIGSSFDGGGLLSEDRIELLEKIGFVWDVHQWQWNQTYYELIDYKRVHGDTNVPMSRGALGLWVFNQRAHYNNYRKGKPSHMTHERAELLRSIGFEFHFGQKLLSAADDRWESRLIELKHYKDEFGTFEVKQRVNPSLYNWCQHQKAGYRANLKGKKSPLKKAREEALQSIGFFDGVTLQNVTSL
ncbi:hypothetical protein HJC23_003850, partial [Cyclotella cryptica]